jgi:hypothetical protein
VSTGQSCCTMLRTNVEKAGRQAIIRPQKPTSILAYDMSYLRSNDNLI